MLGEGLAGSVRFKALVLYTLILKESGGEGSKRERLGRAQRDVQPQ